MDSFRSFPAIAMLRLVLTAREPGNLIVPAAAGLIVPAAAGLIVPAAAGQGSLRRPRDGCQSWVAWSRRSRVASSPGVRADRWSASVAGRRTGAGGSSTGRRIRGIVPDV